MPTSPLPGDRCRAETWAEVRAGDRVIRYRRSGRGPTAVVILSERFGRPRWPELSRALERDFRLIVPQPPALDDDVACWLSDFLDGLGLSSVSMLAADRFCVPALELALMDAARLSHLVLLPDGAAHEGADTERAWLGTIDQHAPLPVLVLRSRRPSEEAIPLIVGFLGTSAGEAPP